MNWQEVFAIIIPIISLMGWIYLRLDKRFEKVFEELKSIRGDIHQLDMRLTRLEGRFDERGYWESREIRRTGTEGEK